MAGDARGYSWSPFEAGNSAAEVHGARSERRVDVVAERIAAELLADESTPDHLRRAEFGGALRAYCRAEAVVALLWGWLAEQDLGEAMADVTRSAETEESRKGRTTRRSVSKRVESVLTQLHRAESRSNSLRRELGLTPAAAGRLARDLSASRWYQGSSPLDRRLAEIEAERQAALEAGDGGR